MGNSVILIVELSWHGDVDLDQELWELWRWSSVVREKLVITEQDVEKARKMFLKQRRNLEKNYDELEPNSSSQ